MSDRALATVAEVQQVRPIDGADSIEALTVRGWTVVARRGEFIAGDRCVFIEIDSFLPVADERFSFLESRGVKTVDGVRGHVLRTAKLRGTVSQGLPLPLSVLPIGTPGAVGTDVTEALGISKYEPPIPSELSQEIVGPFPTKFAPKTDAERVQNLSDWFPLTPGVWLPTEKVDGTSVTYINDGGRLRVCSRNWELADNGGRQWRIAEELDLLSMMRDGDAVQAELFGEGIQSNPLGIKGHRLAVFGVYRNRTPLNLLKWAPWMCELSVPPFDLELPSTVEEAVEQANGIKSLISPERLAEGIVWHDTRGNTYNELGGRSCFKAISNKFLLKHVS